MKATRFIMSVAVCSLFCVPAICTADFPWKLGGNPARIASVNNDIKSMKNARWSKSTAPSTTAEKESAPDGNQLGYWCKQRESKTFSDTLSDAEVIFLGAIADDKAKVDITPVPGSWGSKTVPSFSAAGGPLYDAGLVTSKVFGGNATQYNVTCSYTNDAYYGTTDGAGDVDGVSVYKILFSEGQSTQAASPQPSVDLTPTSASALAASIESETLSSAI
ncbi:TPA: hypothetical protein DDW35_05050 [Candidatus Sumerlaeota bacterium]|jgi:hypothetical protein|nr:hypothetical protein [Candidatus Sumerlaeota bacterium]